MGENKPFALLSLLLLLQIRIDGLLESRGLQKNIAMAGMRLALFDPCFPVFINIGKNVKMIVQ